jgi:hypothetical protein
MGNTKFTSGVNYKVRTVDAFSDPLLTSSDHVIFFSASLAGGTIYLPSPVEGKEYILIRITNTNTANVSSSFASVNGVAIRPLTTTLYTQTRVISDGTDWFASEMLAI